MDYAIIENAPKNWQDWVTAKPNDNREEYIRDLVGILKQDNFNVRTDDIPIEWATAALKQAPAGAYRLMMQRVPVNFGETGEAFGRFYFQRLKEC
jgi:hypothetical protein